MKVRTNSTLTGIACAVAVSLASVATATAQNLVTDPTFANIDSVWEGWEGAPNNGGFQLPSTFTTVASGIATITPGSSSEWNFYQTFGAGPAGNPPLVAGTPYSYTIDSDNSSLDVGTTDQVAFVKAFDAGWGFLVGEFQTVTLPMDGSTSTINFTAQPGTAFYQVGVFTFGTTSGSFDVSNPTLTVVPEPTTFALGGLGLAALLTLRRRS
jgi:hypothetical protein